MSKHLRGQPDFGPSGTHYIRHLMWSGDNHVSQSVCDLMQLLKKLEVWDKPHWSIGDDNTWAWERYEYE
jgi:hypothetical protein